MAAEWGWDGPHYDEGHLVLGDYEAERRYFAAWSEWMDENGVELEERWDRFGQPPMVPDEPWKPELLCGATRRRSIRPTSLPPGFALSIPTSGCRWSTRTSTTQTTTATA
ncbi:MAG TPA: hypothetical protein VK402_18080 [Blastococcus sp.]|nr:hypothetical protein [Blastococcus sp.]